MANNQPIDNDLAVENEPTVEKAVAETSTVPLKIASAVAAVGEILDQLKEYPEEYHKFYKTLIEKVDPRDLSAVIVTVKLEWCSRCLRTKPNNGDIGIIDKHQQFFVYTRDERPIYCGPFSKLYISTKNAINSIIADCRKSKVATWTTLNNSSNKCCVINRATYDAWQDHGCRYVKTAALISPNVELFKDMPVFDTTEDQIIIVFGLSNRGVYSTADYKLPHFWIFRISYTRDFRW